MRRARSPISLSLSRSLALTRVHYSESRVCVRAGSRRPECVLASEAKRNRESERDRDTRFGFDLLKVRTLCPDDDDALFCYCVCVCVCAKKREIERGR